MHLIYEAANECVNPPVRKILVCLSCGCSSLPGKWLQSRQSIVGYINNSRRLAAQLSLQFWTINAALVSLN